VDLNSEAVPITARHDVRNGRYWTPSNGLVNCKERIGPYQVVRWRQALHQTREIGMVRQTCSYDVGTMARSHEAKPCATASDTRLLSLGIGEQRPARHADLLFASKILRSLREGWTPSQRVLECSGFVEHWMIVAGDDVCLLKGTVWRLPVSRNLLATPLLAIDPVAGWARALDEWFTIAPDLDLFAAGIHPDGVADRAAQWLERQLRAEDCADDCLR
jgi:hypothetical protein